jgi:iron(III) transport system substrate-binding protein
MDETKRIFHPRKLPALALAFFCCCAATAAAQDPAWQKEWSRTIEAAKKEGQIYVYIDSWGGVLDAGVFQKAFPEIKVIGVQGRGRELAQRILAERRGGKYVADVSSLGLSSSVLLHRAKAFDPIKPALILPEVKDESKWWQGTHRYLDPEGRYLFRYAAVPQGGLTSYNSQQVNPKDFVSVQDYLNPKWKGKIEMRDIRAGGPGSGAMRFFYYHPEIGPNFIRRLVGDMEVTLFRDDRQATDWLAAGKFAICFFCDTEMVSVAKLQGLPVDRFGTMKEGLAVTSQSGTLALLDKAPHPNAAKVFINWFLSREGQIALQRALAKLGDAPDSLRIDIPKDDVPQGTRRADSIKYMDLDSRPEWHDTDPIRKLFEEALEKAKKK